MSLTEKSSINASDTENWPFAGLLHGVCSNFKGVRVLLLVETFSMCQPEEAGS